MNEKVRRLIILLYGSTPTNNHLIIISLFRSAWAPLHYNYIKYCLADLLMAHKLTTWPTYLNDDAPQGRPFILRLITAFYNQYEDRYNK